MVVETSRMSSSIVAPRQNHFCKTGGKSSVFENCSNSVPFSSLMLQNIFTVATLYNLQFPYVINIYYINNCIPHKNQDICIELVL